jgi:phosphoribosylformylglycinamidine synthase PurS subunit
MIYRARIEVSLKPGHSDPEGETTAKSLKELGYPVEATKISKIYEIALSARSVKEAHRLVDEMCRRLLANPTKDNYNFVIEEMQ